MRSWPSGARRYERGRRRAGGAGRARADRGGHRARGGGRHPDAPSPRRRADRRGRRGAERDEPGHGGRRHRQHRIEDPGSRSARRGARRRRHDAVNALRHRVRGGRAPGAEGQGPTDQPVASRPGRWARRRTVRASEIEPPFTGPRVRAAADEAALPRHDGRAPATSRVGDRHRRDREVAPGVGVREVHRRPGRGRLVASWPLPRLWRRRGVLGPRGDGPDARRHRRG